MRIAIASSLVALCIGCSGSSDALVGLGAAPNGADPGGQNTPLVQGETVGIFELGAPSVTSFTLHGALPVEKQVYPRADGLSPFAVVDPEGHVAPAQVEIVSRYASDDDGADVVEVIAAVARPAASQTGDRLRYRVQYAPHAAGAFVSSADVDALLGRAGSIYLRTKDCFANAYGADLYADARAPDGNLVRTLKDGVCEKQIVTHQVLQPASPSNGPQGTLPHLMGAHAYFTRFANEPFFALDLRIHNASSGLDHQDPSDDALGKIYFRSLELCLPDGWTLLNAFPDPYFGAPHDEGACKVFAASKKAATMTSRAHGFDSTAT